MKHGTALTAHWLLLGLAALGCGSEASDAPGGSSVASGGQSTTGGVPGTGASSATGGSGGVVLQDAGGGDTGGAGNSGGGGGVEECASESVAAEATPVDLFILLDQSGSMTENGNNRWVPTANAIKAFVGEPSFAGMTVALQYFPRGATVVHDEATICVPSNFSTPEVPFGPLPDNAQPIQESIDAHFFTEAEYRTPEHWGTPTTPAVEGVLEYMEGWIAAQAEDRIPVLLIATDGTPSNICDDGPLGNTYNTFETAAGVIAQARDQHGIATYVVGIGEIDNLNTLAHAGTLEDPPRDAFVITDSDQAIEAELVQVLNEIRGLSLPCDYTIPPPSGGEIDFTKVNVDFTDGAGELTELFRVDGAAACDLAAGADSGWYWYYDDPASPTAVILCPTACAGMSGRIGSVDLVYGCDTRIDVH